MNNPELERYGTVYAWESEFKISYQTIKKYLENAPYVLGRIQDKTRLIKFYSESYVRNELKILLNAPPANGEGFLVDEESGEELGTIRYWSEQIGISRKTIKNRLEEAGIVGKTGKNLNGYVLPNGFFSKKNILEACEIMRNSPQANAEGFFEYSGFIYGTVQSWGRKLNLSNSTISKKLEGKKGITGLASSKNLLRDAFYAEEVVLEVCALLLQEMPSVDKNTGFIELQADSGTVRYGTLYAWEQEFKIFNLRDRVDSIQGIKGRDLSGRVREGSFFSEPDILNLCDDLISTPRADENNFLILKVDEQDVRYGNIPAWATELRANEQALRVLLQIEKYTWARNKSGQLSKFYGEEVVRLKVEPELLPETTLGGRLRKRPSHNRSELDPAPDWPRADAEGFLDNEGHKFSTLQNWGRILQLSYKDMKMATAELNSISGYDSDGTFKRSGFYEEELIREACKDLLAIPIKNVQNIVEIAQERYATCSAWGKVLEVSPTTIGNKVPENKMQEITYRNGSGEIRKTLMVEEAEVRASLGDLLTTEQIDDRGFILLENLEGQPERYASIVFWAQELNLASSTISKRLKNIEGRTVRNASGAVLSNGCYPESIVRKTCEDLLAEMPITDQEGFYILEDKKFGSITAWAKKLAVDSGTIRRRTRSLKSIMGKNHAGQILEKGLYAEEDILTVCGDLLVNVIKIPPCGFVQLPMEGELMRFGTIDFWANELSISYSSVLRRVKKNIVGLAAKNESGHIYDNHLFPEDKVRECCCDITQVLPQASEDGCFTFDGRRYSSIQGWSKILGLSQPTIKRRLRNKEGITAKNQTGVVYEKGFYAEEDIQNVCQLEE